MPLERRRRSRSSRRSQSSLHRRMQLFRLRLVAEVVGEGEVVLLAMVVDYVRLRMHLVLLLLQLSGVPDHGEDLLVDPNCPSGQKQKTILQISVTPQKRRPRKMITVPTRMTTITNPFRPGDVAVVVAEAKAVESGRE